MTHPAADLLRAIADGKRVEYLAGKNWESISFSAALNTIAAGKFGRIRISRPMVKRTVKYPQPMLVKPANGTEYWTPTVSMDIARVFKWNDGAYDNAIFAAGMAFATEADAAEAHRALFGGGQ